MSTKIDHADFKELVQKFDLKPVPTKNESSNTLRDLVFGSFIEKGCNAAVYEAKYVDRPIIEENIQSEANTTGTTTLVEDAILTDTMTHETFESDDISILPMVSEDEDDDFDFINESALHFEFYGETQTKMDTKEGMYLIVDDGGSDIIVLDIEEDDCDLLDEENPEIDKPISEKHGEGGGSSLIEDIGLDSKQFDLAVKMMFNYDAESNTLSISQAMKRETVPVQSTTLTNNDALNIIRDDKSIYLPPHPNIVEMKDVFIDHVPDLPDACSKYPAALPTRLHEQGLGRNMTMFLVMKRYTSTLREYLSHNDIDIKTRLLLLSQLLEGIEHLSFHSIAHRDLKSNNILIDAQSKQIPQLVISDFGCCLADGENGLKIPYMSIDQSKGGNPSLMAPEIMCAVPSKSGRNILDYSKSDLWAAGSLAYEIFGLDNPFYGNNNGRTLNSGTYRMCDLPSLPDSVPSLIQDLVYNMLETDPKKRLSPSAAATVIQIFLWNDGYFEFTKQIKKTDIQTLILMLTLEIISKKLYESEESLETELKLTLLKRMTEKDLNDCFNFFCKNSH